MATASARAARGAAAQVARAAAASSASAVILAEQAQVALAAAGATPPGSLVDVEGLGMGRSQRAGTAMLQPARHGKKAQRGPTSLVGREGMWLVVQHMIIAATIAEAAGTALDAL